jgi:phosphoribosylformylglycinamidine synthase subunit PurQ / glutaminase
MRPKVLILHANGINRDLEAANAFEVAGADADIVHINQLRAGDAKWEDYQLLCIPGGFSYADSLGGGKLMALEMNVFFSDQVREFVESGKPVIGICNGFQALVKSGILPDLPLARPAAPAARKGSKAKPAPKAKAAPNAGRATLTFNESGRFECRWIYLKPRSQKCLWTRDLEELVYCPVAHGEGRFLLGDPKELKNLEAEDQLALGFVFPDGSPANGTYPDNPNGSLADVAGICNAKGNVLGLMPHPEDHIYEWQHPRFGRGERGQQGLEIFLNGVDYALEM